MLVIGKISLFFLILQVLVASSSSALVQKCNTNVVVVICKPLVNDDDGSKNSNTNTIFPTQLSERHKHTIQLDKKLNRQIQQTLVLLRSIVISTKNSQPFPGFLYPKPCVNYIIAGKDPRILAEIETEIEKENWDSEFRSILHLSFVKAKYPKGLEWMENVYRQCATLRLFLPEILPDYYKQIIYVDTDIIFLRSPAKLQEGFKYFTPTQLAAITPELGPTTQKQSKIKSLYNPTSHNTGVMLMDLEKMRRTNWSSKVSNLADLVLKESFYGDQDVLIVYFKFNPDELMGLPCHWNYMPKYCRINCGHAEGISIVHGLLGNFLYPPGLPFEVLFRFYQKYPMNQVSNFSIGEFYKGLGDQLWTCVTSSMKYKNYCARFKNETSITFAKILMKSIGELENPIRTQNKIEMFNNKSKPSSSAQTKLFTKTSLLTFPVNKKKLESNPIVLAVTFFDDIKLREYYSDPFPLFTTMLKSLLLHYDKESTITLVVITNKNVNCQLINLVIKNLDPTQLKINFECIVGKYTAGFIWMKLIFKPGVFLRLVYPELIPYDAVIHIDIDIIFRESISRLWLVFTEFLPRQIVGASRQISDPANPDEEYPETSYQAGIMLMNLTRMREIGWANQLQMMAQILKTKFQEEKLLPVQTLLHIYFKYHPEQIFELETAWNFLPHYCNPKLEIQSKIYAIHGVNNSFTSDDTMEPLFRHIFLETLENAGNDIGLFSKTPDFSCTSSCAKSVHFQKEWFGKK